MLEIPVVHRVATLSREGIGPHRKYTHPPETLDGYLSARSDWIGVSGGDLPSGIPDSGESAFLITFDDGYRSVLEKALPVLERHDAPCVVFVTTAFCTGKAYPYELELASVLAELAEIRVPGTGDETPIRLTTRERREEVYRDIRLPLKTESHRTRERFLDALADANRYGRERHQAEAFLDPDDLAELSRHPLVTVGAHGHHHLLLSRTNPWRAWREMTKSRDLLAGIVTGSIDLFSYPYGGNSFVTRSLARISRFRAAFTASGGPLTDSSPGNRYRIPRQDLSEFPAGAVADARGGTESR